MTVIQLQLRSMAAAEQSIAEIWTCLEEYDIPSPAVSFKFHDRGRVTIAMRIDDSVAANTVVARLSTWVGTENLCRDAGRNPGLQLPTHSPNTGGGRGVAPLGWLLAAAAHSRPSHFVSRLKRK